MSPAGLCTPKLRRDLTGGRRIFLIDDEHQKLDIETSREVLLRALGRTVDAITALGIPGVLIGQPPEFFQDPNVCFVERAMLRRNVNDCLRQPRAVTDQRLRASKEILQQVASRRSATTFVSLDSILCDDQVCLTGEDRQSLYQDNNHLDLSGSRVVGRALAEAQASNPFSCREKPTLSSQLIIWATDLAAAGELNAIRSGWQVRCNRTTAGAISIPDLGRRIRLLVRLICRAS